MIVPLVVALYIKSILYTIDDNFINSVQYTFVACVRDDDYQPKSVAGPCAVYFGVYDTMITNHH